MPMLHVAFFNRVFHPDTSATGQLLTELCEGLRREYGYRVTVVAGPRGEAAAGIGTGRRDWLMVRERYEEIDVLRVRGRPWAKRRVVGRFANYLIYFAVACWAALRLDRPQVVVAMTDPPIAGLAAWLAARRHKARLVMVYQDVFPEVGRLLEGFRSPTVDGVLQGVNRFLVRRADRLVVLGDTMRRRIIDGQGADPSKIAIIPNWADCRAIVPGEKRNPLSEALGLADSFVVMHSGNIGLSQDLEVLIEAAGHLRGLADLVIVIAGEGVRKPALEALVRARGLSNVRFLPFQDKPRLAEAFAAADCFVISLRRGLSGYIVPSKLYGILAAGRPYVAAMDPDAEAVELARGEGCGLAVPPAAPAALAAQIRWLYENRARGREMGQRARAVAWRFDRAAAVRAYHDLFRSVAGASA